MTTFGKNRALKCSRREEERRRKGSGSLPAVRCQTTFVLSTLCFLNPEQPKETDGDTESRSLSLKSWGRACFPLLDDPVGGSGSFRGGEAKRRGGAQNDVDPQTFGSGST